MARAKNASKREERLRRAALDGLASRLERLYKTNPTLTINIATSELDATVQDVAEVLDSYLVSGDDVEYIGVGQGGGWVPPAEIEASSEEIGMRWPDGSLRDEAFDIHNAEHRASIGMTDEQYGQMFPERANG